MDRVSYSAYQGPRTFGTRTVGIHSIRDMLTDSVNHYISAFRFPDTADVKRYVPTFNVSNYGQRIRRMLSGSDIFSSTSSTPEETSPDEIFLTPTTSAPIPHKLKCDNV